MRQPPPQRSSQPLVLRREAFGGILFDPAHGTYVELDSEAFSAARAWCLDGRTPAGAQGQALLTRLRDEVPALAESRPRLRLANHHPAPAPRTHFTPLGAPTLVDIQLTRRCTHGCPHCYVDAGPDGAHMPWPDVRAVLRACADAGVCQIAIGGGEPLLHPRLADLLDEAHGLGLVPNLTTTGVGLTESTLDALARCCGAVALSLEGVGERFATRRRQGFTRFGEARAALASRGIPTVLQVTLSAENLADLPAIVDHCLADGDLYGVILLAYKAVGRGEAYDTPLSSLDAREVHATLTDALLRLSPHTRVGYDCCLTPGITGIERELELTEADQLEGCSAARSSIGVSVDLDVVPCTFTTFRPLGNLRTHSLREIWLGHEAEAFRRRLDERAERDPACRSCALQRSCLGGCPEWDLVRCAYGSMRTALEPRGQTAVNPGIAKWDKRGSQR